MSDTDISEQIEYWSTIDQGDGAKFVEIERTYLARIARHCRALEVHRAHLLEALEALGQKKLSANAGDLADLFGAQLVGLKVITMPYGSWPGGPATVVEGDFNEEIVMCVEHDDPDEPGKRRKIGVYADEEVQLVFAASSSS